MLEIRHLCKAYEAETPLKDVNAVINKGDVISVIGPSGTGKTSLIRCINRLEEVTKGDILLNGKSILAADYNRSELHKKIGMVFQNYNLFSHLNVAENIMLGPCRVKGMSRQEAYEQAASLLETIGLADKLLAYPDELSGGQKQRVAIARTLAMEPEIILFDEPTSALDPAMVGEVKSVIYALAKQGMTMMIVTHDMEFARTVSNRIFYMDQGMIYEEGTPEQIFNSPKKERTIQFIRKLSVYKKAYEGKRFDLPELMAQAENFCRKLLIPNRVILRLQMVIEELVVQKILSVSADTIHWKIYIRGAEEDHHPRITVKYDGAVWNPLTGDDFSMKIIRGNAENVTHSAISDGIYTNEISMNI